MLTDNPGESLPLVPGYTSDGLYEVINIFEVAIIFARFSSLYEPLFTKGT
jgi:hypothetical protein